MSSELLSSVLTSPIPMAILAAGLAMTIGVLAFLVNRSKRIIEAADELTELALEGRADEARIKARQSGRALQPLLAVLGGEVVSPQRRGVTADLFWVGLLLVPLVAFVMVSLRVVQQASGGNKIGAAVTLLIGTALLLPSAFAGAISVFEVSRRATRAIRGCVITLLSRNVRALVDQERAAAIRKGGTSDLDPRVD